MGCGWQAVFIICDDKMKVIDSVATSTECRSIITMIQEEYLADSASVEVENICGSGSSSAASKNTPIASETPVINYRIMLYKGPSIC